MSAIISRNQVQSTEKKVVVQYAALTVGASGAVGSEVGQLSFVKESTAGQYSVTSDRKFYRILSFKAIPVKATTSSVAQIQILETPTSLQSGYRADSTFVIQCLDFAGAAVNPAEAEVLLCELVCQESAYTDQE